MRNDLTRSARQQSVERMVESGVDETQSQALYTLAGKRAWEIAAMWRETGRIKINAAFDRGGFLDELLDATLTDGYVAAELDLLDGWQRDQGGRTVAACVRRVAERYGRGRRVNKRGYDVGAAAADAKRAMDVAIQAAAADNLDDDQARKIRIRAAQQVGQNYAAGQRVEHNRRRIADAIAAATDAGEEPTIKSIADSVGMDHRTIQKHWDSAVALVAARRIVAVVTTPAPSPAIGSSVRGVTGGDSQADASQPINHSPENNKTTVQTVPAIETILTPPLLRLVNRLEPADERTRMRSPGRNTLEFARSGFTIHRPAPGRSRLASHRHHRSTVNSYNPAADSRAA